MTDTPKVLWVTSVNEDIWRASGEQLYKSFYKKEIYGDLLVTYEGNIQSLLYTKNSVDISQHFLLTAWLHNYRDIIPKSLGGAADVCKCSNPWARRERDHVDGCHHSWFNRNTSRWFRKIVSLFIANKSDYQYIIWIDADCIFKQQITFEFIDDLLFENGSIECFFMKGERPIIEAGLVGYLADSDLIENFIRAYTKGKFRDYKRWDDSYVLQATIEEGDYKTLDIAWEKSGHSDVMPDSRVGAHIEHFKGRHGRQLGIMK